MNIFIPSCDRAAQLLLLLESLRENSPVKFKPHILWRASTEEFRQGYCAVMLTEVGKACIWKEETNACEQFYQFLHRYNNEAIGLFTDDCIMYRKNDISKDDIRYLLDTEGVWSFNIRLGKNISVNDYVTGKPDQLPAKYFIMDNKYMLWDYSCYSSKWDSYFSFPSSFDGTFFRGSDLLWLANDGKFDKMILWENMICHNGRQEQSPKKFMAAPLQSCVVVQQINSTHSYGHHTNHKFNKSLKELNDKLLQGNKIDLKSIDFSSVACGHGEFPFQWSKI